MRPLLAVLMVACVGSGCAGPRLFTRPAPPSPEEQLDELVRTIDDNFDMLHGELTPSVHKLIDLGEPAIPRMLDLMLLDGGWGWMTRERAVTVIYRIFLHKYGWNNPGPGWADRQDEERFNAFWKSMPKLDPKAPLEERERAVKVWREWFAAQKRDAFTVGTRRQ